jgi:hypothetical protein
MTISRLKIWKKKLIWRSPYDVTISNNNNNNNVLSHQVDATNECFQCFVSSLIGNLILTTNLEDSRINYLIQD